MSIKALIEAEMDLAMLKKKKKKSKTKVDEFRKITGRAGIKLWHLPGLVWTLGFTVNGKMSHWKVLSKTDVI